MQVQNDNYRLSNDFNFGRANNLSVEVASCQHNKAQYFHFPNVHIVHRFHVRGKNNGNNCALIRTMEVHARAFSHVAAWRCYLWALQGWLHFPFEVCSSIVFSSLSSEPLLSSFVALHVPTYHGHRVLSFIVRTLVTLAHTIAYCQCGVQLLHVSTHVTL